MTLVKVGERFKIECSREEAQLLVDGLNACLDSFTPQDGFAGMLEYIGKLELARAELREALDGRFRA